MERKTLNRAAYLVLASAVAGVLLVALGYALFAVAGWDDFCFTPITKSSFEIANGYYWNWSGRWLGIFLYSTFLDHANIVSWRYPFLASTGAALWFLGFLIVASGVGARRPWAWAALMLAVLWTAGIGQGQTFYSFTGAVFYPFPFAMAAASFVLGARGGVGTGRVIASALLALAASAVHELAAICLVGSFASLLLWRRRSGLPSDASVPVMAAAVLGFAIVAFAPGNAARHAFTVHNSPIMLAWYFVRPYQSLIALLVDPRLIAMTALVLALPRGRDREGPPWWWIPATSILVTLLAAAATTFAVQGEASERAIAFLLAVNISAWFAAAWLNRGRLRIAHPQVIAVVLAALLVTAPVVGSVLKSLPETISTWRQENRERIGQLRRGAGQDIAVASFSAVPPLLGDPIERDRRSWMNICAARYFGLNSVWRQP